MDCALVVIYTFNSIHQCASLKEDGFTLNCLVYSTERYEFSCHAKAIYQLTFKNLHSGDQAKAELPLLERKQTHAEYHQGLLRVSFECHLSTYFPLFFFQL